MDEVNEAGMAGDEETEGGKAKREREQRERTGWRMPCVTWDKAGVEVKTEKRGLRKNRERGRRYREVEMKGLEGRIGLTSGGTEVSFRGEVRR